MSILVLAAIATAHNRSLQRAFLVQKFWPDRDDVQGKSSLRQVLTELRKVLAQGDGITLVADSETVRLDAGPGRIDVRDFEEIVDRLITDDAPHIDDADLEQAADLYRGPFMEGIVFDTVEQLHFTAYRELLHNKALCLVEEMSRRPTLATSTMRLATRLLEIDLSAEEAHRAMIRVALRANRINRARKQLELCRKALLDELGAEPERQTIELVASYDSETFAVFDAPREAKPSLPSARLLTPTGNAAEASRRDTGGARIGQALVEVGGRSAFKAGVTGDAMSAPIASDTPRIDRSWVAVLPFSLLGDVDRAFFVDGIVNDLTAALTRRRLFPMVSRQSAYTYKNRFVDARDLGSALGAAYFVDGTVQLAAFEMVLTIQIVETHNGEAIWSRRYREAIPDMFDFQERIVHKMASAIFTAIRDAEMLRFHGAPIDALSPYGILMQAYPRFLRHTDEDNTKAIALLDRAITAAPHCAHALALKSWCHAQRGCFLWGHDADMERQRALTCAQRAETNVGDDAAALAALGATYTMSSVDSPRARRALNRCLEIDPCNGWGWTQLGWLDTLCNKPSEALTSFEKAERLTQQDPLGFYVFFGQALAWSQLGELDRATDLINTGLRAGDAVTWGYWLLASVRSMAGDMTGMHDALRAFRRFYPDATLAQIHKGMPPLMHTAYGPSFDAMKGAGFVLY